MIDNNTDLIEEFIRFLSLNNIQDLRQKKYRYTLGKISEILNKDFSAADKKDIEELIQKIENSNYKDWTKHDYKVTIKKFYTWHHNKENEDIDQWETPKIVKWIKIKVPKTSKKLPSELITPKDIRFLAENSRDLREKALILTLYESGARIGELLNLKIKDINFDDYGLQLNLFGKTGYRKVRLVGSAPSISQWIELEHPKKDDKNSYLFCNTYKTKTKDYRGKKLTYQSIVKIMKKLKERTGFKKDLNFHQFRHSRATELSEFLTDAQRCNYFGWVQGSQICRVYTHLQDTDKAILELNGLVKKEKDKEGKFNNIICPRCNNNNSYGSKLCSKCSLGLDPKSIMEFDQQKEQATEFGFDIKSLLDNKDFKLQIMNLMAEQLDKQKQPK